MGETCEHGYRRCPCGCGSDGAVKQAKEFLQRAEKAERLLAAISPHRSDGTIKCGKCGAELGSDGIMDALGEALDRAEKAEREPFEKAAEVLGEASEKALRDQITALENALANHASYGPLWRTVVKKEAYTEALRAVEGAKSTLTGYFARHDIENVILDLIKKVSQ